MKNFFKMMGIIALIAVIGFGFFSCGSGGAGNSGGGGGGGGGGGQTTTTGSGTYAGKDVLGNSYSLSVGSSAKSALKGDDFRMNLSTRDGKTRNVTGTVVGINNDGTLKLKEKGSNIEFSAKVDGSALETVIGSDSGASLTLNDGTKFIPRTFDTVFLRANRWENESEAKGENWGSGTSALVKDFPANVSMLEPSQGRYTITLSGTSDVSMSYLSVAVQGLTDNDQWVWFGGSDDTRTVSAGTPFNITFNLDVWDTFNFMEFKEIILEVNNVINMTHYIHPEGNVNNGTIPADIPNGSIMATISDFKIKLVDTQRPAITGNMADYTYCIQEDGLSVDYRMARWELNAEALAKAKQVGAKLEITVAASLGQPTLNFVWQDPVRELWWQDASWICGGVEANNWAFGTAGGVTYDDDTKKLSIDLDSVIADDRFYNATALNLVIACWYGSNAEKTNIDTFKITKAEIVQ